METFRGAGDGVPYVPLKNKYLYVIQRKETTEGSKNLRRFE